MSAACFASVAIKSVSSAWLTVSNRMKTMSVDLAAGTCRKEPVMESARLSVVRFLQEAIQERASSALSSPKYDAGTTQYASPRTYIATSGDGGRNLRFLGAPFLMHERAAP